MEPNPHADSIVAILDNLKAAFDFKVFAQDNLINLAPVS